MELGSYYGDRTGIFINLNTYMVVRTASPIYPIALYVLTYLPTSLCARRVYVWITPELTTKLSRDSTTGRCLTNGRLNSLRGKMVMPSYLGLSPAPLTLLIHSLRPNYACAHVDCANARQSH
eukprot:1995626-Pleurochrysis_carterae.AAC.2